MNGAEPNDTPLDSRIDDGGRGLQSGAARTALGVVGHHLVREASGPGPSHHHERHGLARRTTGGFIPYRSSKAAVNMVMRSAAIDLAPRRINCVLVNPGWVRTDMGGPKAPLLPQESVTAMRRLINTLGPKHSGKFYNYDGRDLVIAERRILQPYPGPGARSRSER